MIQNSLSEPLSDMSSASAFLKGSMIHNMSKYFTSSNTKNPFSLLLLNGGSLSSKTVRKLWNRMNQSGCVVCADGAANRLYDAFADEKERESHLPTFIKGDLDSIREPVRKYYEKKGVKIIHDSNQDTHDFQKCIDLVLDTVPNLSWPIVAVNGETADPGPGRIDHQLAIFSQMFAQDKPQIYLYWQHQISFVLQPGKHTILAENFKNVTCGLIPLGTDTPTITTRGLKWDMDNQNLAFARLVSSSNRMIAPTIEIETSGRVLWTHVMFDTE